MQVMVEGSGLNGSGLLNSSIRSKTQWGNTLKFCRKIISEPEFFQSSVRAEYILFIYFWAEYILKHTKFWNFPGGPEVKNPPSNAGDGSSIPGQGAKILHVAGLLNLSPTATELACSGAHTPQWKIPCT